MRVIVYTYRGIKWIIPPFLRLYQKYWKEPITLLAEEDYSDGEVSFAPIPKKFVFGKEALIGKFSDIITDYLQNIPENQVIILMSDHFIEAPVDIFRLKILSEYMEEHKNVLRGQLGDDKNLQGKQEIGNYKDLVILEKGFFPTAITPAIWNKNMYLKLLPQNKNPWQTEWVTKSNFCKLSIRNGLKSISTKPIILSYLNSIRHIEEGFIFLTPAIYEEIKDLLPPSLKIKEIPPEEKQ